MERQCSVRQRPDSEQPLDETTGLVGGGLRRTAGGRCRYDVGTSPIAT